MSKLFDSFYPHNWKLHSADEYESLYICVDCGLRHNSQIDNPQTFDTPIYGCTEPRKPSMPLTYNALTELVANGVLANADPANINPASIDCRLAGHIMFEHECGLQNPAVNQAGKESIRWAERTISPAGFHLAPGEIVLCSTIEVFNLPNNMAAEFRLKSSASRNGLDLALALWCDPGWHGSVLTFQLKNNCRYHTITLNTGMKIGQAIFHAVEPVPEHKSYAHVGQYNNDTETTASKGQR